MKTPSLLAYKKNVFSQNGEDGIIRALCEKLGIAQGSCCEVGAGNGILFSNARSLILNGWRALMIEADKKLYDALKKCYENTPEVMCVQNHIDAVSKTIDAIATTRGFADLDFLCIDIDGLDYEIFESLMMRPKIILVEVNAGHNPTSSKLLPKETAQNNVGQSLAVFSDIAHKKGYYLACYTGNAFYIREDIGMHYAIPKVSDIDTYQDFLEHLSKPERAWLYFVNRGLVAPYFSYSNHLLSKENLKLSRSDIALETLRNMPYLLKSLLSYTH